jgi:branched-chain amino acid aminotransferase
VRTLDKIKIGEGKRGPITKQLQDAYFGIIHGEREDRHEWLTAV